MNTKIQTPLTSPEDLVNQYEHPYVTVNVLLFTIDNKRLKVLLANRKVDPYKGRWAIPGSYMFKGETLEDVAKRQLFEVTGLKTPYIEQLYTFGDPKRDPRSRALSVAYMGLIPNIDIELKSSDRFTNTSWFDATRIPVLAFDHKKILSYALSRLKSKIQYSNIVRHLLPKEFSLGTLQQVYEIILGTTLDKRNFRKKILSIALLTKTGKTFTDHPHRPPMLYSFNDSDTIFFD